MPTAAHDEEFLKAGIADARFKMPFPVYILDKQLHDNPIKGVRRMSAKYQIRCAESDVYVLEKGDRFHITINARVNPLSFGNKLAEFGSMDKAVEAAERFCRMYAVSKEFGYHLADAKLCKEGREPISVPRLINLKLSTDEWRRLLEQDEMMDRIVH